MVAKPFEKYYESLVYLEREYADLGKSIEKLKKELDEKEKLYQEKYNLQKV